MYSREQALQVCMYPVRDVLNAPKSEMEEQLIQIVFTLEKHLFFIDAGKEIPEVMPLNHNTCFATFLKATAF